MYFNSSNKNPRLTETWLDIYPHMRILKKYNLGQRRRDIPGGIVCKIKYRSSRRFPIPPGCGYWCCSYITGSYASATWWRHYRYLSQRHPVTLHNYAAHALLTGKEEEAGCTIGSQQVNLWGEQSWTFLNTIAQGWRQWWQMAEDVGTFWQQKGTQPAPVKQ